MQIFEFLICAKTWACPSVESESRHPLNLIDKRSTLVMAVMTVLLRVERKRTLDAMDREEEEYEGFIKRWFETNPNDYVNLS